MIYVEKNAQTKNGVLKQSRWKWNVAFCHHAWLYQTLSPEWVFSGTSAYIWSFQNPATLSNAKPQSWISRGTKHRCCTKGAHRKYFLGLTVSGSQHYKEKLWLKMLFALQDRSLTFTCHCQKKTDRHIGCVIQKTETLIFRCHCWWKKSCTS